MNENQKRVLLLMEFLFYSAGFPAGQFVPVLKSSGILPVTRLDQNFDPEQLSSKELALLNGYLRKYLRANPSN